MKILNTTMMFLLLLFCASFLVQCEEDEVAQQETSEQYEEDDRRTDEGRGDDVSPGIEGHDVDATDDRVQLIENMQELSNQLDAELEERTEADDQDTYEQIQNDHRELSQIINEAEGADDDSWEEIKEDTQETYMRIAVDYNERVRPDGAHGGREF